jgi:beta-xylosidase
MTFSGSSLGMKKDKSNTPVPVTKELQAEAKLAQGTLLSVDKRSVSDSSPYVSTVWAPDNGNGTYKNPIIYADYSDMDVIRVNDNYYMTASSFSCIPGLPILHSKDLVNWTLIGHALRSYPNDLFDKPQHGKGVWAPSIRYHNNMFYIYWGDPDAGIYMVRSKTAEGPWEEPVMVLPGLGLIDSCPLWDDDGKAYLVHAWAASRAGINSLLTVHRMNADGTKADPEGKHVFDGNEHQPTTEGPKFYKRNGYYYILAPAGGVKTGWQLALRSKNIYGPYKTKVVLEQGSTSINGPHQGAWVETPSGQSWFIHFQDLDAYGRVVHLQPVTWQDDWPLMGRYNESNGKCEPVLTHQKPDISGQFPIANPFESDEFNTDTFGLQWQWQANPKLTWHAMLHDTHYLRLFAEALPEEAKNLWDAGNLLLQKFPAPDFTATTKMTFMPKGEGRFAGLVVMGQDYACLSMTKTKNGFSLAQITCKKAVDGQTEKIIEETTLSNDTVYLRVTVTAPEGTCRFSYSLDGKTFRNLGESFAPKPGKWIGAKVGLFCIRQPDAKTGGHADFDWFRIE